MNFVDGIGVAAIRERLLIESGYYSFHWSRREATIRERLLFEVRRLIEQILYVPRDLTILYLEIVDSIQKDAYKIFINR